jgi:autotransporter translocation and assembly factor TamB
MEGSGEESEVRAGVGKYVGERLFLHYEHGFADEGEDELTAEYELTPNWSVESNASSNEELGADLVFEVEN